MKVIEKIKGAFSTIKDFFIREKKEIPTPEPTPPEAPKGGAPFKPSKVPKTYIKLRNWIINKFPDFETKDWEAEISFHIKNWWSIPKEVQNQIKHDLEVLYYYY